MGGYSQASILRKKKKEFFRPGNLSITVCTAVWPGAPVTKSLTIFNAFLECAEPQAVKHLHYCVGPTPPSESHSHCQVSAWGHQFVSLYKGILCFPSVLWSRLPCASLGFVANSGIMGPQCRLVLLRLWSKLCRASLIVFSKVIRSGGWQGTTSLAVPPRTLPISSDLGS